MLRIRASAAHARSGRTGLGAIVPEHEPRLASAGELASLVRLFCSAEHEIGLKPHVCSETKRPDLQRWFEEKLSAKTVWTTDGTNTLMILGTDPYGIVDELLYVVVSPAFRRKHLGSRLVRALQSKLQVKRISAEARTPASVAMLSGCGFVDTKIQSSGHPILLWER